MEKKCIRLFLLLLISLLAVTVNAKSYNSNLSSGTSGTGMTSTNGSTYYTRTFYISNNSTEDIEITKLQIKVRTNTGGFSNLNYDASSLYGTLGAYKQLSCTLQFRLNYNEFVYEWHYTYKGKEYVFCSASDDPAYVEYPDGIDIDEQTIKDTDKSFSVVVADYASISLANASDSSKKIYITDGKNSYYPTVTCSGNRISFTLSSTLSAGKYDVVFPKESLTLDSQKNEDQESFRLTVTGTSSNPDDSQNGIVDGHEYVDLGLPSGTLWATCNVGASKATEYGDLFRWAETTHFSSGNENTYKYAAYNEDDGKTVLLSSDDAATVNWSNEWRTPTNAEFEELLASCEWEWKSVDGVNGYVVTGSNGASIFLPAAGIGPKESGGRMFSGMWGRYWSSSANGDDGAYELSLGSSWNGTQSNGRVYGESVRPVLKKKNWSNIYLANAEVAWYRIQTDNGMSWYYDIATSTLKLISNSDLTSLDERQYLFAIYRHKDLENKEGNSRWSIVNKYASEINGALYCLGTTDKSATSTPSLVFSEMGSGNYNMNFTYYYGDGFLNTTTQQSWLNEEYTNKNMGNIGYYYSDGPSTMTLRVNSGKLIWGSSFTYSNFMYLNYVKTEKIKKNVAIGDVNVDGKVDISDVVALVGIILDGGKVTNEADVNRDGKINISDISLLVDIILGKTVASDESKPCTVYTLQDGTTKKDYSTTLNYKPERNANEPDVNNKIVSAVIGEGVTVIGSGCFAKCSELTSVTIPEGVTRIENDAFYEDTKLTSITFPSTLEYMGDEIFDRIQSIKEYVLPVALKHIGKYNWHQDASYSLTLTYLGTIAQWNTIDKTEGWDTCWTWAGSGRGGRQIIVKVICSDGELRWENSQWKEYPCKYT